MSALDEVTEVARAYYDSADADRFYYRVWGGEDIHIGLYDSRRCSIREASRAAVERIAEVAGPIGPSTRVLDLGAGYGGAARWLVQRFGCNVVCLNLSEVQNERNRAKNVAGGLMDDIRVVGGSFEAIPAPDEAFEVVWSQDAILHSAHKAQVFDEVARVLAPGGRFVLTDPMQSDDCPDGVLDTVLTRIHLDSMGSVALYRRLARERGLAEHTAELHPDELVTHYRRVGAELQARRAALEAEVSPAYLERMATGLKAWVAAGERGYLNWGILRFDRPNGAGAQA